ncbi:MAG: tetratricopeptide repeat protein [Herminiimonas sp.]|nr:tetratricopeptide repeat protein [Herminiimonas sp.]
MTTPSPLSGKKDPFLRCTTRTVAALASVFLLSVTLPACADDLADVGRLMRAGQSGEALVRVDAFLAKNPRDMQMRFIKGVVLTEQGKTADAITIFTKLTEDHPDLPEPYNNLAVLFAASGQYDKARVALDMAIRTNPSYATAYENLGDVHAKLASQAYDKALQLDSGNSNAKSKLTLLRTLTVNNVAAKDGGGKAAAPVVAAAAPAPAARPVVVATAPTPIVVARAEPAKDDTKQKADAKPDPKARIESKPELKVEAKPEPKPKVAPKPADIKLAAKSDGKPDVKTDAKPAASRQEQDEVMAVVNDWAEAWSAQDVKRYLGHYGNDFETPKSEPRKAWVDERTSRIVGKGRINVKVAAPQVSIIGTQATVKFRQLYTSDRLQADSRKTLVLIRQNGKWQIKQERSGA